MFFYHLFVHYVMNIFGYQIQYKGTFIEIIKEACLLLDSDWLKEMMCVLVGSTAAVTK